MKPQILLLLLMASLCPVGIHAMQDIGPKAYEAIPALHKAGKYAEAEQAARSLVAARTTMLGAEDKETLRVRLLLARILLGLDKEAEAEAQLKELLPVVTRVFGAEQRESLTCQSDLLAATAATGKNAEAEAQYRSFIPTEERVLGPANGLTLKSRWRFSGVLYALGKRADADTEYRQTLELSQRKLTLKDRKYLTTQTTRATTLRIDKKYPEAGLAWQKVIPLQTRLLGSEHPDTLRSAVELAECVEAQGWRPEAEQRLRTVLPLQQRVLGALHPDTLGTCRILAACLQAQGKTQDALPYARRALAGCQQVFGRDHTDTLLCQSLVSSLTQPAAAPQPAAPEDRPVATVDGTPIFTSDLRKTLQVGEEDLRLKYSEDPKKLAAEIASLRRTAIDILIDKQLLANELPRVGVSVNPMLIEEDFNNVIRETAQGNRAAFEEEITRDGLTLEKFRVARQRMVYSTLMRAHIAARVEITEAQVRDYYEKHRQLWSSQEEVNLLSLTIPETLHQTDAATRAHIEALRARIVKGASFAALARTESKDSHAEDGGSWGWTPVTALSAKVRAAVAKTPKGSVSPIIEEPGIFIILGVEDRRTPPPPPFEKVRDQVAARLKDELANEHIEKALVRLRAAADIKKLEPAAVEKKEKDPRKKTREASR